MARGEAPRLSNPPLLLSSPMRAGQSIGWRGGGEAYGRGEFQRGWGIRAHRLKVNVPYQHKKEHMSSVVSNYGHIEQFKHLI